jgi:excinuclease ABC subunit A
METMNSKSKKNKQEENLLEVYGARVHNLKNVDLKIPRDKLVVITGLSGSGKSSLAFDTIYAEGQRRYMETFSAYARQFIGNLERPEVDKITGLSPVISIEQKSVNRNPRSTVGTITEIYDFLRLLYARIGEAWSYRTGEKMIRYTENQIFDLIKKDYAGRKVIVLAPVVKGRKGHYRELLEQFRKQGFLNVRVDGEFKELTFGLQLDRYKVHDIELEIDKIAVDEASERRLIQSVQMGMRYGKGSVLILDHENHDIKYYSKALMCPTSGISYNEPEPNSFSFNSPYGACPKCNGLGTITEVDQKKIFPDPNKSIKKGGIAPIGEYKHNWIFHQMEAIGHKYGFGLDSPIKEIPEEAISTILYGSDENYTIQKEYLGITSTYTLNFEGIINFISNQYRESGSAGIRKWAMNFMNHAKCPECNGMRLKKESLHFKIDGKNISELANLDLIRLEEWIDSLEHKLQKKQKLIAREVLREIRNRIKFLLDVGLEMQ